MEARLVGWAWRLFRPAAGLMPKAVREQLSKDLYQSQSTYLAEEWFAYSTGAGLTSFLIFLPMLWVLFSLTGVGKWSAMPVALVAGFASFLLILHQPTVDKKRFAAEFEADMSLALLVLSIHLNSQARFRDALERVSSGFGHFSTAVGKALRETDAGTPLPEALDRLGYAIDSVYAKRAAGALKGAYASAAAGRRGAPLAALAEEMLKNNENALVEYTAKAGLLSQGATILTVVFPTLLISLLVVASVITKLTVPPLLLSAGIGLGFTLFAALLYYYQMSRLPPFVRRLYKSGGNGFGRRLSALGYGTSARQYAAQSAFVFLCVLLTGLALGGGVALALFAGLVSAALFLVRPTLQFSALQKEVEDELPLVLEQAAQSADGRAEDTIRAIARLGYGRLGMEFAKAENGIRGGEGVDCALARVGEHFGSVMLQHATGLLTHARRTGVDMRDALLETAAYVRRVRFIMQESKAATFGERVTQVFGFFVSAALFGIVVSMGRSLGSLLAGGFFEADASLMAAVEFGVRLNLLVLPFVIAYNVAYLENDMRRVLFYLPALLVGGNVIFLLAGQVSFI